MSSGRAHRWASLILTPISSLPVAYLTRSFHAAFWVGAGCVASIWLTPDLDQEGISEGEWDLVKSFGIAGGLGYLWMAYWHPYAYVIPHHSPWSHMPVWGTFVRALYVAPLILGLVCAALALVSRVVPDVPTVGDVLSDSRVWEAAFWAFIGLCHCDVWHFAMDVLFSRHRRRRRHA